MIIFQNLIWRIVPSTSFLNNGFNSPKIISLIHFGSDLYDSESKRAIWAWVMLLNCVDRWILFKDTLSWWEQEELCDKFFALLFPTFANNHHEKLIVILKEFRKIYNNWRNVLWKKLVERHNKVRRRLSRMYI